MRANSFSLLVLTERPHRTRLFLKKSRTSLPCPVQSRSENALSGRLYPNQSSYKSIEIGGVDVADGDDPEVVGRGGVNRESRSSARQCDEARAAGPLSEENRNLMFVDGEQEQGSRLPFQVGQVRTFKGSV